MDPLPIVLPADPAPPSRPPLPFLAASMPVVGGVVLWLITGSLFSLCFAALGPLMMLASFADASRGRRRERRLLAAENTDAWEAAENELAHLHAEERRRLRARFPDVATCVVQPPLRGANPPDADTPLILGRGTVASGTRTTGGDGDRARTFQQRSRALSASPIRTPLARGVCVRGPAPLSAAAVRALVAQLCLRYSPGQLSLIGDEVVARELDLLPHATHIRRGFRLGVGSTMTHPREADATIWVVEPDAEVPEGITTVLDIGEPGSATLRTPEGVNEVEPEFLSREQFAAIAQSRVDSDDAADVLPDRVMLEDLSQGESVTGLPATIGRGESGEIIVDIVEDGPHAIVTGTTGTGKSELLVSWVTAIASSHGPERVNFVLADFKGGTAFEPLRELRQVVEVITDLDEAGARRGVSSLTAELRRREGVLAASGARDISGAEMPRLVIVVDEFAALLQEHADLGAVFTDIAARGRALGMHLILGTQRAAGVVRDALAANCPLRMSLRVGDTADSKAVIGTAAAAEIPGGASARGLCLVRRPQDSEPLPMRVALTSTDAVDEIAQKWAHESRPRSPWMPALPTMLPLEAVIPGALPGGRLIWGRADAPERQAQPLVTLDVGTDRGVAIIGASGSGRTAALRALYEQSTEALWMPSDPEQLWDVVCALAEGSEELPRLVLCDDLDAKVADLPVDYAQQFALLWEQILRGSPKTTFVLAAMRASGPVGRLLDILPRRALLRAASRVEHVAAGGDTSSYDDRRPPGRARLDGLDVQLAWTPNSAQVRTPRGPARWRPTLPVTVVVSAGADAVASTLKIEQPAAEVWALGSAEATERLAKIRMPASGGVPQIIVGEAELWQREWSLWQRARAEGEVLIRAERPSDLRQLAGHRELPPLARMHAGRVWSLKGAEAPTRFQIPSLVQRSSPRRDSTASPESMPNASAISEGSAEGESRRSRRSRNQPR